MGYGAGAIDTGLNNFVSLHYKAKHMNWLHCCWGLGVTVSPMIMSAFLGGDGTWRNGYRIVALIQFAIALIILASLKKWNVQPKKIAEETQKEIPKKSFFDLLKEKGITVTAQFYVRMPDTWTPVFDLSDKEKVRKINDKAGIKIFKIANQVHRRIRGNRDYGRMPFADLFYKDYEEMRRKDRLSVNDNCIGCGLCEKLCPVEAIEIQNGKPVWIKEKCAMCLGCLHHCPEFAIQRGAKTALHGQYVHK
jgi:ferredoxin